MDQFKNIDKELIFRLVFMSIGIFSIVSGTPNKISIAIAIIFLFMWNEENRMKAERLRKIQHLDNILLRDVIRRLNLGQAKIELSPEDKKIWDEVFGRD